MLIRNPNDYLRIFFDADDGGSGGAGDAGAGAGGDAGAGAGNGDGNQSAATFTQADIDRIVGREKAEAKKAAARELADTLGVSIDEAKAIIEAKNAADEATKSETQRALDAAKAAQAAADQAKAEAAKERFDAKVERALAAAGVDDKALARAARLITLEVDADAEAIAAEIETLKADVPGLFTPTAPAGGTRPPSGVTGARPPAGGNGTVTALDKGAELWKSQKAS